MKEKLEVFAKRYSCRSFTGELPAKEMIEAIALAGAQSPSAMNQQPWLINVITNKSLIDEMDAAALKKMAAMEDKSLYERMISRGGKVFYNAPCLFLLLKQPGTDLDCGIVTENIALAATALGLGNVICGLANFSFDNEKGEAFKQQAGFVAGYEFGMSVLVGFETSPGTQHEVDMDKIRYIG